MKLSTTLFLFCFFVAAEAQGKIAESERITGLIPYRHEQLDYVECRLLVVRMECPLPFLFK